MLLLGLAYFGHTQILVPLAAAYSSVISKVGENNEMLRKAIDQNNKEYGERVALLAKAEAEIKQVSEENRELNQKILATLGELMAVVRANDK